VCACGSLHSPITSRSNWANDSSALRVSRRIEVLNCWVTATNETPLASNFSALEVREGLLEDLLVLGVEPRIKNEIRTLVEEIGEQAPIVCVQACWPSYSSMGLRLWRFGFFC
jgi:hypothetical protein